MPNRVIDRRFLLKGALIAGALATRTAAAASCLSEESHADDSLREALNYTESSEKPEERCSGCAYLSEVNGGCGKCQIFRGPANVNGRCDSWAPRE
jgi:hypothetical protein